MVLLERRSYAARLGAEEAGRVWGSQEASKPQEGPRLVSILAGGGWEMPVAWTPHLSTVKLEVLWFTEAECSAHRPLGSSRVWMV